MGVVVVVNKNCLLTRVVVTGCRTQYQAMSSRIVVQTTQPNILSSYALHCSFISAFLLFCWPLALVWSLVFVRY